eukprot:TRINITY_DN13400_c0_g2_i1.p1 TRINITY_DN13400_c0_g2~~TRINITY_DN13400_c0_g2_i1.p1  ORF type:complete len:246 (+),score=15.42 TRINITY_DN13400_c0_g2_i1:25-738(+)
MGRGRGRGRRDPLIGKTVMISGAGKYKGYIGRVTDVNAESQARVELQSISRTISVDKKRLEELDPEGRPSFGRAAPERRDWDSAGPRQPTWTLYSDRRTPMRDEIQTPLRVSTPLRTPSRDGAWDPMQPMTPLRPETPIYDSWTPATAESSYNPITPGYQSYSSPYTPAASAVPTTPTPSEPASAAYNPTTPTATAETPGYHPETSTPGSAEHYTSTPGYSTATIPTTPGIPATIAP